MDDFEKTALRRRKPVFAEHVDMGQELLADLYTRGLLGDDGLEQVKMERNSGQKAAKLVDWLMETKIEKAFPELCAALVTKYSWLSKEMLTEVRIERGDVVIDDDVLKEAATLVHRKFGTSRRFAETDKKDMTDLIAVKIQLSKEEWRQEMDQLRHELHRFTDLCKQKDLALQNMDATIAKFLKKHEDDMESRAHGMSSTTDVIKTSLPDDDHVGKLRERIRYFLARTERVIEERELMTREREKCMKALQAKDQTVALNDVMVSKMAELPHQVRNYKKELESKERLVERLRKMNAASEEENREKENTVARVRQTLAQRDAALVELQLRLKDLEDKLSDQPVAEKPQNGAAKGSVTVKPGLAKATGSALYRKPATSSKK